MMEEPNDFDDHDKGRVVGITAAPAGWWAVRRDRETEKELGRDAVAAWVLTEVTFRMKDGRLRRHPHVYGVDPSGSGWPGEVIEEFDVDYVYDPHYRRVESGATRDAVPV
jgi:hypothetical protein